METWVEPPDAEGLVRAHAILGDFVCLDQGEFGVFGDSGGKNPVAALLAIVRRHPMRRQQVVETLRKLAPEDVEPILRGFEEVEEIQKINYRGEAYYVVRDVRSRIS
jgi:hypothetical protein